MSTNNPPNIKLSHLQWLVQSRSKNQQSALTLFSLLTENAKILKELKYESFSPHLVGITFSLWRAVFLADKEEHVEKTLASSLSFLETVISDNAITYVQDKRERNWTFNYYMSNVRFTLDGLNRIAPKLVPNWQIVPRTPTEKWDYGQTLLAKTIDNLDNALTSNLPIISFMEDIK